MEKPKLLSSLHSGRAQERAIQLKHVLHFAGLKRMAAAFNAQPGAAPAPIG